MRRPDAKAAYQAERRLQAASGLGYLRTMENQVEKQLEIEMET